VHLELADRAMQGAKEDYEGLKGKCRECGVVHREVFPIARCGTDGAERVYEDVVRECICRWERFIRQICGD
jgi:rubredoxin